MGIKNYSLLKCRPIHYGIGSGHPPNSKPKKGGRPHFQILVEGKRGQLHRIAVNIVSSEVKQGSGESLIRMRHVQKFNLEELTSKLLRKSLGFGFHALESVPDEMALDFVRMKGLVETRDMKRMPREQTGPKNDLQELLQDFLDLAINNSCILYAFGAAWTDSKQIFFAEENGGIHDIHCNQGNPRSGGHAKDNGIWQDGALLLYNPSTENWSAVFLAFESQFSGQSILTDNKGSKLNDVPRRSGSTTKNPQKRKSKKGR